MYLEELLIIIVIVVGIYLYRNYKGENIGKFITDSVKRGIRQKQEGKILMLD